MTVEDTADKRAYLAASRRFPHCERAIRKLYEADESFAEICGELAEAELALLATNDLPAPLRDVRRAEWEELVGRIAEEVEAAIRRDISE